jgi:hypothetical protein
MSNIKDKVLKIYVSAEEHAEIKSQIAKKGISISDYFLKLYRDKPLIVRERNEAFNNIRDLRGVANNINQIAKRLNEAKPSEILSSTLLQISVLNERVNKILDSVE